MHLATVDDTGTATSTLVLFCTIAKFRYFIAHGFRQFRYS